MFRLFGLLLLSTIFSFSCGRSKQVVIEKALKDTVLIGSPQPLPVKSDPLMEEDLRESAMQGNLEAVRYLIRRKVNINAIDQDGRTALMLAAFNGHTPIVKELLGLGMPVDLKDKAGRTALIYASTGPYPETVNLLLTHNADPDIADRDEKFTALMFAASEGNLDVVRVLLNAKADPSLKDKDNDDAATFAYRNGHTAVADFIKAAIK